MAPRGLPIEPPRTSFDLGSRVPPLRVVVDSNVFARNRWIGPIVENARAGVVQPIWSPSIIAEASRLLAWLYIRRNPDGLQTRQWRSQFSDASKRWYAWVSEVFEVIDDRPPYEAQWSSEPADPWDQPVWTAAVRSNAFIVVTDNLADGPPVGDSGIRKYRHINYVHPEALIRVLDLWADKMWESRLPLIDVDAAAETIPLPESESTSQHAQSRDLHDINPVLRKALDEILEQAEVRQRPANPGESRSRPQEPPA
jgi:hypothetical protein